MSTTTISTRSKNPWDIHSNRVNWCEWEIVFHDKDRSEIYDYAERYLLMAGIQNNCGVAYEVKQAFQYLLKIKM